MSKVRRKFNKEFKLASVRMVTENKLSRVEVARRLVVNPTQIRQWAQEIISEGPEQSCPENGKLKRLSIVAANAWNRMQHEPQGELLGQQCGRKLFWNSQTRARLFFGIYDP